MARMTRSQLWVDPALYRELKVSAAILGRQIGQIADEVIGRGLPAVQKRAGECRARETTAKARRAEARRAENATH